MKLIILLFRYRDLKVIILGPASVGKTCFMQRYMTGEFHDKYVPVSIHTSSTYVIHGVNCKVVLKFLGLIAQYTSYNAHAT